MNPDSATVIPCREVGTVPQELQIHTTTDYASLEFRARKDTVATVEVVGKEEPILGYRLQADDVLTTCVLFCFFLISYVLTNGKHYLAQQVKNLFQMRERSSIFAVETGSDVSYRMLLAIQSTLLLGIFFFDNSHNNSPELFEQYPSVCLLACYVGVVVAFYLLKQLIYTWVNWVFFDKQKNALWHEAYTVVYSLFGVLMFPLLLLTVYFDLSNWNSMVLFAIIAFLCESILFYKCFNIFFAKMYGNLYLIVYFCALEIVPCYLLWQTLLYTNNLLILKTVVP